MRCFFHADKPAIGNCKSCQRGLCQECAVEYPQGLACSGRCEADVEALIDLIRRNVEAAGVGTQLLLGYRRALFASAAFILLISAVFIVAAFRGDTFHGFLFAFGSMCALFGLYHSYRAFKLRAPGQ